MDSQIWWWFWWMTYVGMNMDELYDLEEDPYEMNNVIQDPDYQTVLEEMKLELKNY
ncbi:MAG: sulfatase/phosphatase domain-containing protein [Cyclobacteriaceae bacterium]